MKNRLIALVALAMSLAISGSASAAEVLLLSTTSAKEALGELIPMFERTSGHTVVAAFSPGSAMSDRIANGGQADVLIAPADLNVQLLSRGRIVAGSRTDFARSTTAVAVRAGMSNPRRASGRHC